MIIDRNLRRFIVYAEDSVLEALRRISDNRCRIIFLLTESGRLEGVLTDGDLRRWLVSQPSVNLSIPAKTISNKDFVFAFSDDPQSSILGLFNDRVTHVPIVDRQMHLSGVAYLQADGILIGPHRIADELPAFIVAEIGNNHNGDLDLCRKLIDAAAWAGADCAKFQMRNLGSLYRSAAQADDPSEDLGSQYTLDLLSRFNLSKEALFAAFDHCHSRNIIPLCTPWDAESVAALEEYGMPAYKVASADLTNIDLLRRVAQTRKPILLSTGMSTDKEIREAVSELRACGARFVLLHCNSTYPAPFRDINLRYMERLRGIGQCPVGYSGHERGYNVAVAAVAQGARVIEKHLTLDRSMEGNDHKVSLLPAEFAAMVKAIREVEQALGSAGERKLTQGEIMNREVLAKSLIAARDIAAGEIITSDSIDVKSPGRGLQPNHRNRLMGRPAIRPIRRGDFFYPSDLGEKGAAPRQYRFRRPWGVPVRYHDHQEILSRVTPDFLEYHLSYKDLDIALGDYFDRPLDTGLVVHAPELFAHDHILDLCSPDEAYRLRSIEEMRRVIAVTRALQGFHRRTQRPLIVTNLGGFTDEEPLSTAEREKRYELLQDSLGRLDASGVEIIAQTMPPFPWHFGGQRLHNLFVDPQEIVEFCLSTMNFRICLDISHSKLACNHFKWSFGRFVATVAPYIAHLHIVDARGVDGEGLQIGEGDVDFAALADQLDQLAPHASFIPEIWQGHKNAGEGFWIALDRLEQFF
ncbi:N-acetylneuraminate synthase family protein [Azospirillum tabaci]|uniref:N-acetylneuraminate synthase family protein n=1 Tax=Azospirillum tabaci TaxID=2752310 RepID=UPI001660622C|nr:N-acetylneuraminate synthase family protein [Azospirillum tabaci]